MNLADFSNQKLDKAKPFNLVFPDGSVSDAKIYIKSLKSKDVIRETDAIAKRANQAVAKGLDYAIKSDIEMCCAIVEAIEGFTIQPEENTFGFETDGDRIVSTKDNIRLLMEHFHFVRQQVAAQANDDSFFYLN